MKQKQSLKQKHILGTLAFISLFFIVYSFINENLDILIRYIAIFVFASTISILYMYRKNNKSIQRLFWLENRLNHWNSISYRVKKAGEISFNELPIGIVVFSNDRVIEWANNYAKEVFLSPLIERKIENISADLNTKIKILREFEIELYGRTFACKVLTEDNILYLIDKTDVKATEEKYKSRMLVMGILELDNLNEALESHDAQERAKQISNLMGILGEWSDNFDIYLRGFSEERYLLVMDRSQLSRLIEDKFKIIETIRDYCNKEDIRVTASIGIACQDIKSSDLIEVAEEQLMLAVNRGGNQCVVKIEDEVTYYGARTNSVETRSPVYVRVKTETLADLITSSSKVYIMSHKDMDADAFGASLAANKLAQSLNRFSKIVFDENLIDETIDNIYSIIKKEYVNILDNIITPKEALDKITDDTLLIIVDTQYQNLLLSEKLFKKAKRIAILDHHRRNNLAINNYDFLYTQSSASSSVELIVEMYQYLENEVTMSSVEATWMLMGVIVDTNNLMYRVSYRTFNVLSLLQKHGAEMAKVQRFLRENFDEYMKRMTILNNLEIIDGKYGIALANDDIYPRAFLAKIADNVISVNNIKASFCIGRIDEDEVGISARSLDEVNVQLIMEQLGGGGHFNNAATQIKNITIAEARLALLEKLKRIEEGGLSTMRIILTKDVKGKGKAGEIIDIPAGHANFLVRSSQAVIASPDNIKQLEKQQEEKKKADERHLNEMKELKEIIESKPVQIAVKVGKEGKLFGTVSSKQIVDEYKNQHNIIIDKRKMLLDEDIAALGTYKIPLQLHKQVTATITLFVVEKN
jgi:ribosomal protein L9